MNACGGGGGESPVPVSLELRAAAVAPVGMGKNLLRLEIEKAETHGAMAHNSLDVAAAAAAAICLFGVERNHHVAALPDAFDARIAAKSDTVAQGPNANH